MKLISKCLVEVLILGLGVVGCQTLGNDDEDDYNQRRSYVRQDDQELLPNPKSVSQDALYQKVEQEKKLAERKSGSLANDDTLSGSETEMGDINAAMAEILVPQKQAESSYFIPSKGKKEGATETQRRRPIYLGKAGFEKLTNQAQNALTQNSPAFVTGGFQLSAKRGPMNFTPREGMGTYIVKPGDTLSTISVAIYGTAGRWMELAHINRLGNGSVIFPSELILYIPDAKRANP